MLHIFELGPATGPYLTFMTSSANISAVDAHETGSNQFSPSAERRIVREVPVAVYRNGHVVCRDFLRLPRYINYYNTAAIFAPSGELS